MPESKTHLVLRTFLFRLLRFALGPDHSVGSEQFIYWNAADPTCCLAPDAFVRLGVRDTSFKTWKTWEQGGAPDLAVEIVSESDRPTWDEKLQRYHELGVRELVRFDPNAATALRIRVWDRVDDDLVERENDGDRTPCLTLGLHWIVQSVESEPVGLRLVGDDGELVLAPEESEAKARAEEAKARAEEAKAHAEEAKARAAAEARVRVLEEEVRRLRGGD